MWAWEGKSEDAWNRTALLACLLANANRDPKKRKRPFGVEDFHPHRKRGPKRGAIKATPQLLAALFCDHGRRN